MGMLQRQELLGTSCSDHQGPLTPRPPVKHWVTLFSQLENWRRSWFPIEMWNREIGNSLAKHKVDHRRPTDSRIPTVAYPPNRINSYSANCPSNTNCCKTAWSHPPHSQHYIYGNAKNQRKGLVVYHKNLDPWLLDSNCKACSGILAGKWKSHWHAIVPPPCSPSHISHRSLLKN